MSAMTNANDLTKRQRLALRRAREGGGMGAAPTMCVRGLVKRGLAVLSGHMHERCEWGRVVAREPAFYLTPAGEALADALVDALRTAD